MLHPQQPDESKNSSAKEYLESPFQFEFIQTRPPAQLNKAMIFHKIRLQLDLEGIKFLLIVYGNGGRCSGGIIGINRTITNPIVGEKVTFLKTAEETNGRQTVVEVDLMPNANGTPMHYHESITETFTVIQGELVLEVDKKQVLLKKGETVSVKTNINHRFFNPTRQFIKFEVVLSPASAKFEQGLRIAYGLACDGECNGQGLPRKLSHLAILFDMGESRLPGIMSMIMPFLNKLAAKARKNGVEEQVVAKYCQ